MAADTELLAEPSGPPSWRGPFDITLENGLRVLFVQRHKSPIVELRLVVEGGFAADPGRRSGLAALATAMFSEGLLHVDGAQLDSAMDARVALLHSQVRPDAAVIGISALDANLSDALRIFVEALTHPEFKTEDFELLQANRLALIARERLDPFELALRVLPRLVYGRGHIYARPFSGSGTEKGVAAITCDDLRSYYETHLAPQSATLVVVAAWEPADLRTRLDATFGQWRAATATAVPPLMAKIVESVPSVVTVDRPGASQAVLAAGLPTFARNSANAVALIVANTILAGAFTSRLNLRLREHKGWTYGVRSSLMDARMQGFWIIRTALETDCVAAAMAEIAGEIDNLAGLRPATPGEFSRAVDYLVARMPSSYETCAQIADALAYVIIHGLAASDTQNLATRLRRLTSADVTETCRQILAAGGLRWMVVGKAAELNDQLRDAGFSRIEIIDSFSSELP
jgi:zinc protease